VETVHSRLYVKESEKSKAQVEKELAESAPKDFSMASLLTESNKVSLADSEKENEDDKDKKD
jgi:hypothetical protein